jgi:hypothetical protein
MLQGPAGQAPYGWTHCLTLSQAALAAGAEPDRELAVAAAYVATHWSAHERGRLDPEYEPSPERMSLTAALAESPADAAAAAWYTDDPGTWSELISRAAIGHDAQQVKYTLACFDAAKERPPRRAPLPGLCLPDGVVGGNPDPTDPLIPTSRRASVPSE